jgi:hypothetical protein
MKPGFIRQLAKKRCVKKMTLQHWRANLRKDPIWQLYFGMKMNHRAFTDEQNAHLAEFLLRNFIRKFGHYPQNIVNHPARLFKQRIQEGFNTLTDAEGTISTHWRMNQKLPSWKKIWAETRKDS